VHEIGRELDHIGEVSALRFQRGFDIGENLPALGVEIGFAHELATAIGCHLAGDEQELGRLDTGDLGVLAERLAQHIGVVDRDLGHVGSWSVGATQLLTRWE
jgi:hypothetical protein